METVRTIDAFLANTYGIADPSTFDILSRKLEGVATTDRHAARLLRVLEERNVVYAEQGSTAKVDARFFDLTAVPPYAGWIHELKRACILDAAVALTQLISDLDITGPVLDVGCHVGYHASWLASRTHLPVTGIDRSTRAVALARTIAATHAPSASFEVADFPRVPGTAAFEFVYSVDGPYFFKRGNPQLAAFFRDRLVEGGVFAVVGEAWPPFAAMTTMARELSLYPLLSDVVGGWMGQEFEGMPLLVFLKSSTPLDVSSTLDRFDAVWESNFRTYANLTSTSRREKTQAYCRARALAHQNH